MKLALCLPLSLSLTLTLRPCPLSPTNLNVMEPVFEAALSGDGVNAEYIDCCLKVYHPPWMGDFICGVVHSRVVAIYGILGVVTGNEGLCESKDFFCKIYTCTHI